MAQGKTTEKEQLRRELNCSRTLLDKEVQQFAVELNFFRIVQHSFIKHPWMWKGSLFLGGLALSNFLFSGRKYHARRLNASINQGEVNSTKTKSSLMRTISKASFSLALPFFKQYIAKSLEKHLSSRS